MSTPVDVARLSTAIIAAIPLSVGGLGVAVNIFPAVKTTFLVPQSAMPKRNVKNLRSQVIMDYYIKIFVL